MNTLISPTLLTKTAYQFSLSQYAPNSHPLVLFEKNETAFCQLIIAQATIAFEQLHAIYSLFKYSEVFAKRQQLLAQHKEDVMVKGLLLSLTDQYIPTISVLTTFALGLKCIDTLLQQYDRIGHTYQILQHQRELRVVTFEMSYFQQAKAENLYIPPSIHQKLENCRTFIIRCCRIMYCWLRLVWEIVKLNLIIKDIQLIYTNHAQTKLRTYTELAADLSKYSCQLNDQTFLKKQLLQRMDLGKELLSQLSPDLAQSISVPLDELTIKTVNVVAQVTAVSVQAAQEITQQHDFFRPGKTTTFTLTHEQHYSPRLDLSALNTEPREKDQTNLTTTLQKLFNKLFNI